MKILSVKEDKDKTVLELQFPFMAKLTIGLKKKQGGNPFYDERFAKAIEDLKKAIKEAFIFWRKF